MDMTFVEEMENHYVKLITLSSYSARRNHLDACITIYESHPEVQKYFVYRPYMRNLDCRFTRRSLRKDDLNCAFSDINNRSELSVYHIDCLNISNYEYVSGLYFLGDIKYDPVYGKIYLVKIGCSSNLSKRLSQYLTYNPMFFCKASILETNAYEYAEENAHKFLTRVSIGRPEYSKEWFIVDEETYFELCDKFCDKAFFRAVASGCYNN